MLARMYVVLTLLSIIPALIVVQIISIHLNKGEDLRLQGEQQARSYKAIPALRGSILDANGRTLAANSARYVVSVDPTMPGFKADASEFYNRLEKLTGRPASYFKNRVNSPTSPKYVTLLNSVTESQGETIDAWGYDAVILEPRFSRTYNYSKMLAHVLGHVSADNSGIAGLELQYEKHLQGVPGKLAIKKDRNGQHQAVAGGPIVRPVQGENLVLTIDVVHQSILEEELARGAAEAGATWATAIAMDPRTGAILAMANVPTYDPNRPAAYATHARRNHAITDRIEPGSTFKLVSAAVALEQRVVSLSDSIETGNGFAVVSGVGISDTHANGTITFEQAIALSSNIAFAKVSTEIDHGKLYQYARNFGFGQPTWIDLPGEVGGRLKKPSEWSKTTPSRLSIGYEVEVTPLQVLAAYAALANDGLLVQPYLVAARTDVQGQRIWTARQDSVRRAFKAKTARKLLPAFEKVINEGTATEANIAGVRIAGKTGTANKVVNGKYDRSRSRASFVGYFPADNPEVAMIVVMDEPALSPYGGVVAAPVFRRVAERWLNTMPQLYHLASDLQDTDTDTIPKRDLPRVEGQPVSLAAAHLEAAGFQPSRIRGDQKDWLVTNVSTTNKGIIPVARMDYEPPKDAEKVMPNMEGLSVRQATNWLMANGIEVTVHGHGSVAAQTPPAGDTVDGRATLRGTR
ncbi:MAG: PASTA domain-containing protein [Rhodothermales bacterium]|nr:PASTA domain-containing protein [Rhodothermales bacterium]